MRFSHCLLIIFGVLLADQAVKLLVHNQMLLGEHGEIAIFGDWFKLHYTLNEGMAFGMKLGSAYGKLYLTVFRWIAMLGIAWFLFIFVKKSMHWGFLVSLSLVVGGAFGNVVDSTFYGVLLDNAPYVEYEPPFYPWFHGQVVDMFYFDVWRGYLPDWWPLLGGRYFAFWPIFNIADAAIFCGVFSILIFQKKFFPQEQAQMQPAELPSENPSGNSAL